MRKLILFAISVMSLQACGLRKVDYGSVGVVVNLAGDDRGVGNDTYSPGYVLINPFFNDLYEFPTTLQSRVWTSSPHEGKSVDESISFASMESAQCTANVYIAYQFDRSMIPYIVRKYKMNADDITDTFVRSVVRAEFSEAGGNMKAIDIAGAGTTRLTNTVKDNLNKKLNREGIYFREVNIVGKPKLPSNIQASIDTAIAATQEAIAAENRKRITQAEADQAVIKALGEKRAIEANPYYLETMNSGVDKNWWKNSSSNGNRNKFFQ